VLSWWRDQKNGMFGEGKKNGEENAFAKKRERGELVVEKRKKKELYRKITGGKVSIAGHK